MKKQIPNIITLLNLLCGVIAIIFVFYFKDNKFASLFIVLGAVFDFFDGMTARALKVSSPIGVELDSLSDVISFGVAPSCIAFSLIGFDNHGFIALIPLLMALFSSYRLAKFNLDTRQTTSFIGLPTPANAILWLSIPLIDLQTRFHILYDIMSSVYFIVPVSVLMCYLLVSEIPMFSLKFHNLKWKDNSLRFVFLILSAILLGVLWFAALPIIIILYIILSVINNLKIKTR